MNKDARHRLLSGVRVSILVLEELRSAQREGRPYDAPLMMVSAQWAEAKLREVVVAYYERKRRRAGYQ
jgi:hypothetical protein